MVCPTPAQQKVFQESVRAVSEHQERLQRLEVELCEQIHVWRLFPAGQALQAMRGVQFTVAITLIAELGALRRFENPRQLMRSLGLTPASTPVANAAAKVASPKADNTVARRALLGGLRPSVSGQGQPPSPMRLEQLLQAIQNIRWKAQVRLCKRFRYLTAPGKHANQVVVAIAQEMAAFIWAIAREVQMTR